MITIYYPHLDLENRGLIRTTTDHIVNIKLLTLMADHVLVLSSHLLDAQVDYLSMIRNGLSSFIADGKIKTVLYNGYPTLEAYLYHKVEEAMSQALRIEYQEKANYIATQIFNNKNNFVYVDNEQEREQFHSIYVDTSLSKAKQTGNNWLIHSALVFQDEINKRKDQKATYLTLPEINRAIYDLMSSGQIKETHYPFFLHNQVCSYYYCGSLANSAIPAFNPYFDEIQFDKTSSRITNRAYDPVFFMKILTGLNIIDSSEDINRLSSKDVDVIRHHRAWKNFQELFSTLYNETFIFDTFIKQEQNIQKREKMIKEFLFNVPLTLFNTALLSPLTVLGLPGIIINAMLSYIVSNCRTARIIRETTIDRIIENLIASEEPLYVITSRLKRTVDRIMYR